MARQCYGKVNRLGQCYGEVNRLAQCFGEKCRGVLTVTRKMREIAGEPRGELPHTSGVQNVSEGISCTMMNQRSEATIVS